MGIDFSDAPGTGSPSAIWKEDLPRVTQWLKWYTNDNVKYEFVTNPNWLRAPKTSEKYDAQNNTIKGPGVVEVGGMNDEEIAADYFQAINDSVDLSNVNA